MRTCSDNPRSFRIFRVWNAGTRTRLDSRLFVRRGYKTCLPCIGVTQWHGDFLFVLKKRSDAKLVKKIHPDSEPETEKWKRVWREQRAGIGKKERRAGEAIRRTLTWGLGVRTGTTGSPVSRVVKEER